MNREEQVALQYLCERNVKKVACNFYNHIDRFQSDYINSVNTENNCISSNIRKSIRDVLNLQFNPKFPQLDSYPELKAALQLNAKLKYLVALKWREAECSIDVIIHEIAKDNVDLNRVCQAFICTDKGYPFRQPTDD